MATYRWENSPLVHQVDVATPKKGMASAVLHLNPAATESGSAQDMVSQLRNHGLTVIPDTLNDAPILRVPNLPSEKQLLEQLQNQGAATGNASTEQAAQKLTLKEKWKRNTAKIAGYTYLGGDLSMAAGGIARATEGFKSAPDGWEGKNGKQGWKDILKGQFSTGWLWLVGGLGLGRYASEPAARKQDRLLRDTSEFFWLESVDVPEHSVLHKQEVKAPRTGLKKAEDFMYRYPTEFLNFFFAVGSGFLAKAGWQKDDNTGQRNWGKFASGVLVFLGAVNGMLFKPKKTDPDGKAAGLWQKIRSNPLIVTSAAYYANNATGLWGAAMEKKQQNKLLEDIAPKVKSSPDQKTHIWHGAEKNRPSYAEQQQSILSGRQFPMLDLGGYSFYGVANAALMMTSKDGGHGSSASGGSEPDVANTVYAAAAEVLASLPEQKREELLPKLAEHLRKARGIGSFSEDIEAAIRQKVESLKNHPIIATPARTTTGDVPVITTNSDSPHIPAATHRKRVEASRSPAASAMEPAVAL